MITAENNAFLTTDEEDLRAFIGKLISTSFGYYVHIVNLRCQPSAFATLSAVEVISVELDTGVNVSLFVKRTAEGQWDHPDKQIRDRECRIYKEMLDDANLPVVKFFGCRRSSRKGHLELFLEFVSDWNLKYHSLEYWFLAARMLAKLHVYFAADSKRLSRGKYLLQMNETYYHGWAERALRSVSAYSKKNAGKILSIVKAYSTVAKTLCEQPMTLVHNDLSPKNVLIDRNSKPNIK